MKPCVVLPVRLAPRADRQYLFQIVGTDGHSIDIAAESEDEMNDWILKIREQTNAAQELVSHCFQPGAHANTEVELITSSLNKSRSYNLT